MGLISRTKQSLFKGLRTIGASSRIADSEWRRSRLLVLAYHGLSLRDEHQWNPDLFFPVEILRRRLELLRELKAHVLPLTEALDRLASGTLPPRSVCLTFDDGNWDFYHVALPLLEEFGYPSTVYVTTFYSLYQRPVFDVMAPYLLWRGRTGRLDLEGLLEIPGEWDLTDSGTRDALWLEILAQTKGRTTADQKDALLEELCSRLGLDYEDLVASRMFQIMRPDEITEAHRRGASVQLHTHRHRVPWTEAEFAKEIHDNAAFIREATGTRPDHFCYPSGEYRLEVVPWLEALGVRSAVTCVPGLATTRSELLLTPRFVDSAEVEDEVFAAWVTGVAPLLPRRSHHPKVERPVDAPEAR